MPRWSAESIRSRTPVLVDARERARLHPETFSVPGRRDITRALKAGNSVKVIDNAKGERFWVVVVRVGHGGAPCVGIVANELLDPAGYSFGDAISFKRKHVIDFVEYSRPERGRQVEAMLAIATLRLQPTA